MEIKYFSKKAAILRNMISFILLIGVAYLMGLLIKKEEIEAIYEKAGKL